MMQRVIEFHDRWCTPSMIYLCETVALVGCLVVALVGLFVGR